MPSPVGHAIAGLTTAWIADRVLRKVRLKPDTTEAEVRLQPDTTEAEVRLEPGTTDAGRWLPLACVVAAAAPDLDLLVSTHRTYSHSLGAAILAGLCAWLVLKIKSKGKRQKSNSAAGTFAFLIATAYFSHIVLDWLGKDTSVPPGMMALWPISSTFYLSGLDLFPEISRRYWRPSEFIVGNLRSLAWEMVILGPVAAVAWRIRVRTGNERIHR